MEGQIVKPNFTEALYDAHRENAALKTSIRRAIKAGGEKTLAVRLKNELRRKKQPSNFKSLISEIENPHTPVKRREEIIREVGEASLQIHVGDKAHFQGKAMLVRDFVYSLDRKMVLPRLIEINESKADG